MTEEELKKFCEANPGCGGFCKRCPAFAKWWEHELGLDEHEDDDCDEDDED